MEGLRLFNFTDYFLLNKKPKKNDAKFETFCVLDADDHVKLFCLRTGEFSKTGTTKWMAPYG